MSDSDQLVHVVAVITGKPGTGDQIEPMLQALADGTHGEQGCVLYSLHRGLENPDQFTTVEKWTSTEALDGHLHSAHLQTALGAAGELLAEPPLIIPSHLLSSTDEAKSRY